MRTFTNSEVAAALTGRDALTAMRNAYEGMYRGNAAIQARSRMAVADKKFSTMSAMLLSDDIAAVKMYTTLQDRFRFHIALISLHDGAMLALMEADALTQLRTAATSALAASYLARPDCCRLGVIGAGVQAEAHAALFIEMFGLTEVCVHARNHERAATLAELLCKKWDVDAYPADAKRAASADIVILATRSHSPVIHGEWLSPGAFVASIGATRPEQREMDDLCIARATQVVADWTEQAMQESGDFRLLPWGTLDRKPVVDLFNVVGCGYPRRSDDEGIVIYKAVGNALQDAAIAALAYARLSVE